jgi:integrase
MRGAITKRSVEALPAGATLHDTQIAGFLARRLPSGAVSYGYRYRANGKQPLLALGVHGSITATDARRLAQRAAGRLAGGHDPQEERNAHRAKVANSVNTVLDQFLARYVRAKGLRSADGIEATFRLHVRPAIGGTSVYDVTRSMIIGMLDAVEDASGPVAAHSAYKFTAQAFGWWALRDERFRSPIVRGMGRVRVSERARKRVLDDQEIRDLWAALDIVKGVPPCLPNYVRGLLLSGRRRDELAKMRWEEVSEGLWVIPPERSKTKGEIVQPMTPAFRELLGPERSAGYVFSASEPKYPLGALSRHKKALDAAIAQIREAAGRPAMPPWRWHDLRRTARTLLSRLSRAGVLPDIAEMVLGHAPPGGLVRRTYDVIARGKGVARRARRSAPRRAARRDRRNRQGQRAPSHERPLSGAAGGRGVEVFVLGRRA